MSPDHAEAFFQALSDAFRTWSIMSVVSIFEQQRSVVLRSQCPAKAWRRCGGTPAYSRLVTHDFLNPEQAIAVVGETTVYRVLKAFSWGQDQQPSLIPGLVCAPIGGLR